MLPIRFSFIPLDVELLLAQWDKNTHPKSAKPDPAMEEFITNFKCGTGLSLKDMKWKE